MGIAALVLLTILAGTMGGDGPVNRAAEATQRLNPPSSLSSPPNSSQIKISIATGGGPYGPAKDTYQVGERIPVVITVTNTGTQPVSVCETGTLYQDRPQLLKDGKEIPYESFQQSAMEAAEKEKTCATVNLPQQILLRPNEPTVIDWFVLMKGATSFNDVAWYEQLPPGKYTLSNQRRLSCCDGPLTETNTIKFQVVP
jgi:hypothetical protein